MSKNPNNFKFNGETILAERGLLCYFIISEIMSIALHTGALNI